MKDAFGNVKYTPNDIFSDEDVIEQVKLFLNEWIDFLELGGKEKNVKEALIRETLNSIKKSSKYSEDLSLDLIEKYSNMNLLDKMWQKMGNRGEMIYRYINKFIKPGTRVLDVGAGPGIVASYLQKKGYKVVMEDVRDVRLNDKDIKKIPFYIFENGKPLGFRDNEFDNSLLLTVLHHCTDPLQVLDETIRVTKSRIVILESVYGIEKNDISEKEYRKHKEFYDHYFKMTEAQKKMYSTFIDWFLNKLSFKNNADVPCNYGSPRIWDEIFKKRGLKILKKDVVGIDQLATPEIHILYILEK